MTTRQRILAAAAEVFAAEGYFRATMDDIARRAGLSKGALYFHFPSKEELFLSLMDHMAQLLWDAVGEALGSARGASARIAAALRAALDVFERHPELTRVTVVQGATAGDTALARQQALRDAFEDVIARYVEELVADGDAPPQDARLTALALFGSVWAVVSEWATRPAPRPLAAMADGIITYNLRGIGVRLGQD